MSIAASPSHDAVPQPARQVRARLSLRSRVAINVVAITALIQLILGMIVFQYFRATIDDFFNNRLHTRLKWAAADITGSPGPITTESLVTVSQRTSRLVAFSSLVLVVRDAAGKVTAHSDPDIDVSHLPPAAEGGGKPQTAMVPMHGIRSPTGEADPLPARTITIPFTLNSGERRFLTGAVSNLQTAELTTVVGRAILIASLLGLLATGTATWFITGYALKPLNQLRTVAEQFSLEKLSQPAPAMNPVPELTQITAELDAARNRIRLAVQANERFISNVSHELKTPVAVLRIEAQTLEATDIPPRTREFVRSVIEETRRLGTMVDSFLTLASVRSGRALNTTKPVYLNDIMLETVTHCAAIAKQNNVSVIPELYEADEDLVVPGDPDLLRVIFDNLLRNALRFSPPGGAVVATVAVDGDVVTISITDQGPGIPPELLPRLFERFSQASNEIDRGRGHGLGLSIAQGIAELHGGHISAHNLPEGGCRFTLTLPRIQLLAQHTPAPRPQQAAPAATMPS